MARKKHQQGGATMYGKEVNSISTFDPKTIQGLVFWIQADMDTVKTESIKSYASHQLPKLKETIQEQFANRLNEQVITEIRSKVSSPANSLVRLDIYDTLADTFPTYNTHSDRLDTLSIGGSGGSPLQVVSSAELELPDNFSVYTISKGVQIQYLKSLEKILILPADPNSPAELSEILVYSRPLTTDEDQLLKGYLAYRENTQHALEPSNPYIPDMLGTVPELAPVAKQLAEIERSATITLAALKTIEPVFDPAIDRLADTILEGVLHLRNTLSKHVLSATEKQLTESAIQERLTELEGKLSKLKEAKAKATATQTGGGAQDALQAHKDSIAKQGDHLHEMQTADILTTTHQEIKARNAYQLLRAQQTSLELYGKSFYESLYSKFADAIDATVDTFDYHFSTARRAQAATMSLFTPIEAKFTSGKLIAQLADMFDTTILTVATDISGQTGGAAAKPKFTYDNLVQTVAPSVVQYRDPYVQSLQGRYELARNLVLYGDFAYLYQSIERIYAYILQLQDVIEAKDIHPILQPLYESIYTERFTEFQRLTDRFTKLDAIVSAELDEFGKTIDMMIGQPTKSTLESVFEYRDTVKPAYIRRVTDSDMHLYGFEYIVTDKGGAAAAIPQLWFPELIDIEQGADGVYSYTTPYFTDGKPLVQTYTVLEPYTDTVIEMFTANKPATHVHDMTTPFYEIPIRQMNSIISMRTATLENRVLLPIYGLEANTHVLIFNTGMVPIPVTIPGGAQEYKDVIAPGAGTIYIYSSSEADEFFYGKVNWIGGFLPYDTLLDSPKTTTCAFVEELNTFIYVYSQKPSKKLYSALLDHAGHAIEVKRHTDNYVYDIDDAFHCNPYTVTAITSTTVAELQRFSSKKTLQLRPSDPVLQIRQHSGTGLPLLCVEGRPGINAFGFAKVCQNPVLRINGELKTRGAYGDMVVVPGGEPITAQLQIEPFVTFDYLFRPHFVRPLGTDFVFATYSTFPIVAPDGSYVQLDSITKQSIGMIYFNDGESDVLDVSIMKDALADDGTAKKPYHWIDVDGYRHAQTNRTTVLNAWTHYTGAIDYLKTLLHELEADTAVLTTFAEYETANSVNEIAECKKVVLKYLADLNTISATLTVIHENPTSITPDVKGSLDVLKIKLRDAMEYSQEAYAIVQTYLADFKVILAGIEEVKARFAELHDTGPVAFKTSIAKLHATLQSEIAARFTTSAPDLEALMHSLVDFQAKFAAAMEAIATKLATRPKYKDEIETWLKEVRGALTDAGLLVGHAEQIINVEMDQAILAYKRRGELQTLYMALHANETVFKEMNTKRMAAETTMEHLKSTLDPSSPIVSMYQGVEDAFNLQVDGKLRDLKTKVLQAMQDTSISIESFSEANDEITRGNEVLRGALEKFTLAIAAVS